MAFRFPIIQALIDLDYLDTIQHVPNSRHVAVLVDGYFYVFDLIDANGHRLTAVEIERFVTRNTFNCFHSNPHRQLNVIVKDRQSAPEPGAAGMVTTAFPLSSFD